MKKHQDIVKRVLFTMMILVVYALGQQIMLPGFDITLARKIRANE